MRRLLWLGALLPLFACGGGQLRFSPVLEYAETNGFDSPIATGRLVLVALENSATAEPLGNMTLEVEPQDGGSARAFPLGLATFGIILETPGRYDLVASDNGAEVGRQSLSAEEEVGVRLASIASIKTIQNQGTDSECSETDVDKHFDPTGFVLHSNQTLELAAVPLSAAGDPMVGLLPLSAAGPSSVLLSAVELRQGGLANAVEVEPLSFDTTDVALDFSETTLAQSFSVSLQTSAEADVRRCP